MKKRILLWVLACCFSTAWAQRGIDNVALADQYFTNGELTKATELYEKLFEHNSNAVFLQRLLACYVGQKQEEKAEKLIKKLIKKYPDNLSFHIDLGSIYKKSGKFKDAQKQFETVLGAINKNNLYQLNQLAVDFERVDELDYAVAAYKQGRKAVGDPLQYFEEICLIYKQKGDNNVLFDEMLNVLDKETRYLEFIEAQLADALDEQAAADVLKGKLIDRINNDPQNIAYNELLIWFYMQKGQFDKALDQAIALDKRFKEDGNRIMSLAELAVSNKKYESAIKAYEYISAKGKVNPRHLDAAINKLSTQYKQAIATGYQLSALQALCSAYTRHLQEWGKDRGSASLMKELAMLYGFYLGKLDSAEWVLEEIIALPGLNKRLQAECKLDLGDVYIANGQPWEGVLVYGQVEKAFKDDPLGQEAKFRNARLSYYQGDFDWAKAQLNVLKGSTSQLFANDALNLSLLIADNSGLDTTTDALKLYAQADLLIFQNRFAEANMKLDSINALFPNHALADELLMARARMEGKKQNSIAAADLLATVIEKYPGDIWADDALFMLANLQENKLNKRDEAMKNYQRILTDYPGSLYVVEARKHYRVLRGDVNQ